MSIRQELERATNKGALYLHAPPSLELRAKLAQFAIVNGLRSESEALVIVAMRYFEMAESERWKGWLGETT